MSGTPPIETASWPPGRILGLWGIYAGIAALLAWRLLPVLGTHLPHFPSDPDVQLGFWFPWHSSLQVRAGENPFLAPELLWPQGMDLTLFLWNLGCPLLNLPLYLLFPPIIAFNLSIFSMAGLNGLAGHFLGERVGGSRAAAWGAGFAACLAFEPLYELGSGRPEQGFIAPMILAAIAFFEVMEDPRSRRWVLTLGLSMAGAGLCYWYHPYFLALCLGPVLLLRALRGGLARRAWLAFGLAALVAGIAVLPAMIPVLRALSEPGSTWQRAMEGGFTAARLLASRESQSLPLAGLFWPVLPGATIDAVVPLATLLPLLGVVAWRPARHRGAGWLLLAVLALIVAMGPVLLATPGSPLEFLGNNLTMPFSAMDILPGLRRFWWPRRFLAIATVGQVGALAALVGALRGRKAWLVVAFLTLALVGEHHALGPRGRTVFGGGAAHEVWVSDFFQRLGQDPWRQPLVQIPILVAPNDAVLDQVFHHQPMFGALAQNNPDLIPPHLTLMARREPWCHLTREGACGQDPPPGQLIEALRQEGFRWAVLRYDSFGQAQDALAWGVARLGEPTLQEGSLAAWDLGMPVVP